jgi:hypothetical protein
MTKEDLLKMTDGRRIAELIKEHPQLKDWDTIAHSMRMLSEEKAREGRDTNIHYDPVPRRRLTEK